jgi:hypothetical protein
MAARMSKGLEQQETESPTFDLQQISTFAFSKLTRPPYGGQAFPLTQAIQVVAGSAL